MSSNTAKTFRDAVITILSDVEVAESLLFCGIFFPVLLIVSFGVQNPFNFTQFYLSNLRIISVLLEFLYRKFYLCVS